MHCFPRETTKSLFTGIAARTQSDIGDQIKCYCTSHSKLQSLQIIPITHLEKPKKCAFLGQIAYFIEKKNLLHVKNAVPKNEIRTTLSSSRPPFPSPTLSPQEAGCRQDSFRAGPWPPSKGSPQGVHDMDPRL